MGSHNGHGFYTDLYINLFTDLKVQYPEMKKDLERDLETILERTSKEGLSFLTKTLPKYAKAVEIALCTKAALVIPNFHKRGTTGLPAFLRGFLQLVFDKRGQPLAHPSPGALLEVRQICYLLYKLEVPYNEGVIETKIADFIQVDNSLHLPRDSFTREDWRVLVTARAVLTHLFKDYRADALKPKHGPGAVAGGEKPWEKGRFKYFVKQIDKVFPYSDWFYLSPTHFCDELENYLGLEEVEYLLSKTQFVPKDSRGPRMIAMEPQEYMWVQQAIKSKLYEYIEDHALTKGHVNFTNQNVNRDLALSASLTQAYDTLDMKDASDRVSLELVELLFSATPLYEQLLATRTPGVVLPNGQIHMYRKFAPMGSALCFPIEALVFWALSASVIHVFKEVPLRIACKQIYVYGDDIIVPHDYSKIVMSILPHYNLMFNEAKSCIAGFFRESCGCDAFMGVDVTPVKVKRLFPEKSLVPEALVSYVEYSNIFYRRGYYNVSEYLKQSVEGLLGPLPIVQELTPLAWYSRTHRVIPNSLPRRYNKNLQRKEVKTWALTPHIYEETECSDWNRLFLSILAGLRERGPWVHDVPHRSKLKKVWKYL